MQDYYNWGHDPHAKELSKSDDSDDVNDQHIQWVYLTINFGQQCKIRGYLFIYLSIINNIYIYIYPVKFSFLY